jgi:uncharacterized protein YutE (UPF0331/DUF86 family)
VTPRSLDRDVAARRLRLLRDTLDELGQLQDVTAQRLQSEPLTRAATERLIQVAVDLAIDVNTHIAVSLLGRSPDAGYQSFELAAEAGAIGADLARQLAPAAGLRNRLVHRYAEIRLELVAAAVGDVLSGFGDYVKQAAAFIERAGSGKPVSAHDTHAEPES